MSLPLKKHKRATIALGTLVEISLWLDVRENPDEFFRAAHRIINEIHNLMSLRNNNSDLSRYRLAQCGDQIPIHAHTTRVLQFSEQLWQASDGYFDVCVGDTLANSGYLPKDLRANSKNVPRTQALEIHNLHDGGAILYKTQDNVIDLGGVAKGYAVDCAIQTLQGLNIPAAMVNAGGDMRIYGDVEELIHIRENDCFVPLWILNNQALATSAMPSNLEVTLSCLPIVNPKTQSGLEISTQSKSIIADSAIVADALTKLAWLNVLDHNVCQRYNAQLIQ